jgi:hypothetical protein
MQTIVRAWLFPVIAGNCKSKKDEKRVESLVRHWYPNARIYHIWTKLDYCLVVECDTFIQITVRGTHGWRAWLDNFKCRANSFGFHRSFWAASSELVGPVLAILQKPNNEGKQLYGAGHSRGGPISLFVNAQLRTYGYAVKDNVTYCGAEGVTEKGAKALEVVGVTNYAVISPNDIVDNVGVNGWGGVQYGKVIQLPKSPEKGFWERLKDKIPGWGHSYSEVTDGLIKKAENENCQVEVAILQAIRRIAAI